MPVTPFTQPLVFVTDCYTATVSYWAVQGVRLTSPGLCFSNRRVGKTSPGLAGTISPSCATSLFPPLAFVCRCVSDLAV